MPKKNIFILFGFLSILGNIFCSKQYPFVALFLFCLVFIFLGISQYYSLSDKKRFIVFLLPIFLFEGAVITGFLSGQWGGNWVFVNKIMWPVALISLGIATYFAYGDSKKEYGKWLMAAFFLAAVASGIYNFAHSPLYMLPIIGAVICIFIGSKVVSKVT